MREALGSRPQARVAGGLLLLGAMMMFAGGGTPLVTSLGREVWNLRGTDQLVLIASDLTAWSWANGLILAGTVLTLAGLAAAIPWLEYHRVSAGTRWMVAGVLFAGTALWMAALVGRLSVTLWAAELAREDSPLALVYEGFDRFQERALDVFMILGLGSLAVLGAALTRAGLRLWGGALVTMGALGLGLTLVAERIPAFVYMGTAVLGLALLATRPTDHPSNKPAQVGLPS